jgi:cyanophycinase-like exopeptidase
VSTWTFIRFLHLAGVVFFVGGQLLLVVAVTPVLRGDEVAMRAVAKRFGMGSAVALVVIIATGAAMASHFGAWERPVLHAKLALLVLVGVLTGLHVVSARTRAISLALVVASLVIVWLGVKLTYG